MKLHFGDQIIELGESKNLSVTFPIFLFGRDVGVRLTISELSADDLTALYGCGDMLSNDGDHLASSVCDESPTHQIKLEIQIRVGEVTPEGTVRVQMNTCHAVACSEHCMAVAHQLLFVAAVFLGIRFNLEDENDEIGDDISPDDPT